MSPRAAAPFAPAPAAGLAMCMTPGGESMSTMAWPADAESQWSGTMAAAWLPSVAGADMWSVAITITAMILAVGHTSIMAMNTTATIVVMAIAG